VELQKLLEMADSSADLGEGLAAVLERLASLHERGLLSDEEFENAKQRALGAAQASSAQTGRPSGSSTASQSKPPETHGDREPEQVLVEASAERTPHRPRRKIYSEAVVVALAAVVLVGALVLYERRGSTAKPYDGASTNLCWTALGLTSQFTQRTAGTLTVGSYYVVLPGNKVTVAFWTSERDAQNEILIAQSIPGVTSDTNYRRRNVTVAWDSSPSSDERRTVDGCLR
jgi:hypothetical protein